MGDLMRATSRRVSDALSLGAGLSDTSQTHPSAGYYGERLRRHMRPVSALSCYPLLAAIRCRSLPLAAITALRYAALIACAPLVSQP
jgi:hypothetical protein